jgi:hypothetical protein
MPSVGGATTSSFPCSRFEIHTLFCASTTTAATPSIDSTSLKPFSGPRMKTASSIASARNALGAQMVTLRHAVAG